MKRKLTITEKFTLIELLVVVAIFGILISILLPSLEKARYETRKALCASNIKQTGTGLALFNISHDGHFPDVQNNFGQKPYRTYVAKWSNTGKWYNLGQLYSEELIQNTQIFFCPQNETNRDIQYTFKHNQKNNEYDINSSDYYIRSSYQLLFNKMSTSARRKLKISILESDQLLLNDYAINEGNVAHNRNKPGWNFMKTDGSVKFKHSTKVWQIIISENVGHDWSKAETIKEELLR